MIFSLHSLLFTVHVITKKKGVGPFLLNCSLSVRVGKTVENIVSFSFFSVFEGNLTLTGLIAVE